jgi:hypothetical protein
LADLSLTNNGVFLSSKGIMENSFNYKWVVILFFGVVGIIFTVSVFYLAAGNVAPDTFFGRKMTLPKSSTTSSGRSADRHVLELNQGKTIGNRIVFYKGRQGDRIVFDVIIPELDRQYPYSFKVDLSVAKNGFEVSGIWFKLITVRPNFVSVKVM